MTKSCSARTDYLICSIPTVDITDSYRSQATFAIRPNPMRRSTNQLRNLAASVMLIAIASLSGCRSICLSPPNDSYLADCSSDCFQPGTQPIASLQRPYVGQRLSGGLHDNWISRKIASHNEAKNAPPWPRFHPLPSHPVFYPPAADDMALDPVRFGEFESAQ